MEQFIRVGMDTSKHVFQLHGVNAAGVEEDSLSERRLPGVDVGTDADVSELLDIRCHRVLAARPSGRLTRPARAIGRGHRNLPKQRRACDRLTGKSDWTRA